VSGQLLVKSSVGTWGAATIHEVSTGLRFLFARDLLENATSLLLSTTRQALFTTILCRLGISQSIFTRGGLVGTFVLSYLRLLPSCLLLLSRSIWSRSGESHLGDMKALHNHTRNVCWTPTRPVPWEPSFNPDKHSTAHLFLYHSSISLTATSRLDLCQTISLHNKGIIASLVVSYSLDLSVVPVTFFRPDSDIVSHLRPFYLQCSLLFPDSGSASSSRTSIHGHEIFALVTSLIRASTHTP